MRRLSIVVVSIAAALVGMRSSASAVVVCPDGEPSFPYLDDGNGCFDPGTDTEVPVASLLGVYNAPPPKSLVIPKRAKIVGPAGTALEWHAVSIFLRGKVVTTDAPFNIVAASFFEILGKVSATGVGGDVELECNPTPCSAASTIASGVSIEASEDVAVGSTLAIDAGAKITAGANVSVNLFTSIGEKVSLLASQNLTLVGSAISADIHDKAKLTALNGTLGVSVAGANPVNVGNGAKLRGVGVTLGFGGSMTFGDKVRFTCGASGCSLNNGSNRTFGEKLKIVSEGAVAIGGSGTTTIGVGAKISGASISFSQGAQLNIAEGAKLSCGAAMNLGGGGATTLGNGAKLTAQSILITGTSASAGAGCSLTASNSFGISTGGTVDIGAGTKIEAAQISLTNGSNLTIGNGVKAEAVSGPFSVSSAGLVNIGDKSKLTGVGISLTSGDARTIGSGVKIDAGTGAFSVGTTSSTTVGSGTKFIGASGSFGHSSDLILDGGCSVTTTNGSLSISTGAAVVIGSGSTLSTAGGLTISNATVRQIGDGVTIASTGALSLDGGGATTLGADVAIEGQSVSLGGLGGIAAGDGLSVESTAGNVLFQGGSAVTIGLKPAIKSPASISFSHPGALTIGDKGKLTALGAISISNGSSTNVGIRNKWKSTTSDMSVSSPLGITFGSGSKLSAGDSVDLLAPGGSVHLGEKVKLRSGTLDDPMMPASEIALEALVVQLDLKVALSGADGINSIVMTPHNSLSALEAKIFGKTITVGVADGALTSLALTDSKVKGSDDPATATFIGPSATCDLTGTTFSHITVDTTACATVVGP